ncbi:MAG TPA: hypothetical protein VI389_04680 [Geobacteraceae bacterium]
MMSDRERPPLRLIRCSRSPAIIGTVRVGIASPDDVAPVDAVVLEEDTWLILSADPEVTISHEHPVRLMTRLLEAQPLPTGTVFVRQGVPLTLVAVVHDFGAEPCCRPEWVAAALTEILRICRERKLHSLQLPLLGVRHGRLTTATVLPLLVRALSDEAQGGPKLVRLIVPPEAVVEVRRGLIASSRPDI